MSTTCARYWPSTCGTTTPRGRTALLASSHRLELIPGHRRSTSPSTGSAGNKSSAGSRTSARSPPDGPALLREEAGRRHDRVFEPHRLAPVSVHDLFGGFAPLPAVVVSDYQQRSGSEQVMRGHRAAIFLCGGDDFNAPAGSFCVPAPRPPAPVLGHGPARQAATELVNDERHARAWVSRLVWV